MRRFSCRTIAALARNTPRSCPFDMKKASSPWRVGSQVQLHHQTWDSKAMRVEQPGHKKGLFFAQSSIMSLSITLAMAAFRHGQKMPSGRQPLRPLRPWLSVAVLAVPRLSKCFPKSDRKLLWFWQKLDWVVPKFVLIWYGIIYLESGCCCKVLLYVSKHEASEHGDCVSCTFFWVL